MSQRLWPAIDVTEWKEVQAETRGQRAKWWVRDATTSEWLRKQPRPVRTSEPAIEIFALELARASGIDAAVARPCIWQANDGVHRGIVVRLFLDREREELSLGSEVLQMHVPGYDPESRWAQTPARARDTLQQLGQRVGADLVSPFAQMLAFDAWIGNGDRHQENWGVIRTVRPAATAVRLAPMFDPAACLGSELQDQFILLREPSKERLQKYIDNCPSGFGDGQAPLILADVVAQWAAWPEWTKNVRAWLAAFDSSMNTGLRLLAEIPDDWLSQPRKQLAANLLVARLNWLKEFS